MDHPLPRTQSTIGLVADPGRAARLVAGIVGSLPGLLAREVDGSVDWKVDHSVRTFPLDGHDDVVHLGGSVRTLRERQGWDIAVYVTDLARFGDDCVVAADVASDDAAALVSLPALGTGRFGGLRRVLRQVVGVIHTKRIAHSDADHATDRFRRRFSPLEGPVPSERDGIGSTVVMGRPLARVRLLLGMVLGNRPWRLVGNLSSALVAAAAAGLFGIFYASIAQLADASGPVRLSGITVAVVALVTPWFIVRHRLWQRPPREAASFGICYNASSLGTVVVGVASLYLVLFCFFAVAAGLILPPGYLEQTLGHPVTVADYLDLAWLSTSMGMIVGAIGTSFDDPDRIRQALYTSREADRRAPDRSEDS